MCLHLCVWIYLHVNIYIYLFPILGNNYFTSINTYYLNEFNSCDKFISWGAKDTNKIVPGFNLNTINRKTNYKKKGNLLVVCGAIGTGQLPIDRNTQDEKNVNVVVDLVKQLKINKKFIKIRPHPTHFNSFNGYYYHKYLKRLNVNKYFLGKNIFKLIKKSRVVFFNYDSTGLLENLSLNIPSVCFWHDTYSHIDDKYIGKYKKLVEGKILFTTKEEKQTLNFLFWVTKFMFWSRNLCFWSRNLW